MGFGFQWARGSWEKKKSHKDRPKKVICRAILLLISGKLFFNQLTMVLVTHILITLYIFFFF
jgi:hypothetical protein